MKGTGWPVAKGAGLEACMRLSAQVYVIRRVIVPLAVRPWPLQLACLTPSLWHMLQEELGVLGSPEVRRKLQHHLRTAFL